MLWFLDHMLHASILNHLVFELVTVISISKISTSLDEISLLKYIYEKEFDLVCSGYRNYYHSQNLFLQIKWGLRQNVKLLSSYQHNASSTSIKVNNDDSEAIQYLIKKNPPIVVGFI